MNPNTPAYLKPIGDIIKINAAKDIRRKRLEHAQRTASPLGEIEIYDFE